MLVTGSKQRSSWGSLVRENFQEILAPGRGVWSLHKIWNHSTSLAFQARIYFQRTSWMLYPTFWHLAIQPILQQTRIKSQLISRCSFSWACHQLYRNKRTHPGFSTPWGKQGAPPWSLQSALWTGTQLPLLNVVKKNVYVIWLHFLWLVIVFSFSIRLILQIWLISIYYIYMFTTGSKTWQINYPN